MRSVSTPRHETHEVTQLSQRIDARVNATRIESASETFLFYKNGLWFWIYLLAVALLVLAYFVFRPVEGNNGGTWLGYILGTIATGGIAYLMWYGIRKRSYRSSNTTLQGCLSGHVWLGLSLAIIVPLHSGFQFGFNVHTLAYALMMVVIISGVYGAFNYINLAPQIAAHRGGGHTLQLIEQINRFSNEISSLISERSDAFVELRNAFDFALVPGLLNLLKRTALPAFDQNTVTRLLSNVPESEHTDAIKMMSIITRKRELAARLQEDARTLTLLKIWLWVHIPVSLALVFCVVIHIFVVFLYR